MRCSIAARAPLAPFIDVLLTSSDFCLLRHLAVFILGFWLIEGVCFWVSAMTVSGA